MARVRERLFMEVKGRAGSDLSMIFGLKEIIMAMIVLLGSRI